MSSAAAAAHDAPTESKSPQSALNEAPVAATPVSGSTIDQLKAALEKKKRRMLIAAIEGAVRAELEGDELLVEFTPENGHYRTTLAKAENARVLREVCAEVCGREIGIRFAIKDDDATEVPASPEEESRRAKELVRQAVTQDPAVQQVLRAFGGEIVDIKMQ